MKLSLAVFGSVAAAGALAASAIPEEDHHELIEEELDTFSSRSLADSPVPLPVVAILTILNFFKALEESDLEGGRAGDVSGSGGWGVGSMWRAVKNVPRVFYETTTMVAPLTLRYVLSDDSHPHCQQQMICELNNRIKERYGKPGEVAMQLASSVAGYAMVGNDAQKYDSLIDAGRNGRRGKDCSDLYPKCVARSDNSAVPALLRLASKLIKKGDGN